MTDIARTHDWLCHPDDGPCPDGCDTPADPERLAAYQAGRMDEEPWVEINLANLLAERDALAARVAELEALATVDPLTGLLNRRGGEQALEAALRRASRTGSPVCLIALDLDHFKRVNDRHGHGGGDQVLQQVGMMLRTILRANDTAIRMGGEEILLITDNGPEGAHALAEKIRKAIKLVAFPDPDGRHPVTASLGIAQLTGNLAASLEAADRALYQAKAAGRDRVYS